MPKDAKPPKTRAETGAAELEQLSKRARASVAKGIAGLEACIDTIAASLLKDYNPELATQLGVLTDKVAKIMGEVRKAEADERKANTAVTLQAVLVFLRQMAPSEWAHVRAQLDAHHAGGSVLA